MRLRIAVIAFAGLGGVALASTAACAMPNGIPKTNEIIGQTSDIQQAVWVRDWRGRRVWRPNNRRGARAMYRRPPGWRNRRWRGW